MDSDCFNSQQIDPLDLDPSTGDIPSPVIKVENLRVFRGGHLAVDDVSFELAPRTHTAIVGPNGAGKSTLIQAILGLIPQASGQVQIFGRPRSRLGDLQHWIGYIPQSFSFDRGFPVSVAEFVGLGWAAKHRRRLVPWQAQPAKTLAVTRALGQVQAVHLQGQPLGSLSGGELKRVLLAYCLVLPRKLLILDEALEAVDVQGEADFYNRLHTLQWEQGWTILQISHDLEMVSEHSDRVLCLNRRLICDGQPQAALSDQSLLEAYGPAFSRYHHHH